MELGISLIDKLSIKEFVPIKPGSLIYSMLFLCFGSINLLHKIWKSFLDGEQLNWIHWILECSSIFVISLSITAFFSGIIYISNSIAEYIFPIESLHTFHDSLFNKNSIWIALFTKNILSLDFLGFFNSCLYYLAQISFLGLLLWRAIRLLSLFCLCQIHVLKSLIPVFGSTSLLHYLSDIISVATWNIYFAAGNKVMFIIQEDSQLWQQENDHYLPTLFAIYCIYIFLIPSMAKHHFRIINNKINVNTLKTI